MYAGPALAADRILRVALTVQGSDTFTDPRLENVAGEPTGYSIGAMSGTTFYGNTKVDDSKLTIRLINNSFVVSETDSGKVLYTSAPGADYLAISPNSKLTWFRGFQWRGQFVYKRASGDDITVINYVELEDYVKGVLPYEVDPSWPEEVLKAQAVCARSYAVCTHKHEKDGYDLCNTTSCQAYYGTNTATEASDAAVDKTAGEIIAYKGSAVEGNFFSSDGGATEDALNVWGTDIAYLKGKLDPYEENSEEWTVTLTAEEVRQKLTAAGYTIGRVKNVEVTKRTEMDNVAEVSVTDVNGNTVRLEHSEVRTVFGLKSMRYTITSDVGTVKQLNYSSVSIKPSSHKVLVDGSLVNPQGYNIDGNNYFKLRDVAYIMNGTSSQFDVSWNKEDSCIVITSNMPYQPVGGEMNQEVNKVNSCSPSVFSIELNGKKVSMPGYNINGNTYYKIRDIADALGFDVGFINPYVMIQSSGVSDTGVDPDDPNQLSSVPAGSFTFTGKGWGHSVGMSQWGAYAMAKKGFSYKDILKFYYTGIEILK